MGPGSRIRRVVVTCSAAIGLALAGLTGCGGGDDDGPDSAAPATPDRTTSPAPDPDDGDGDSGQEESGGEPGGGDHDPSGGLPVVEEMPESWPQVVPLPADGAVMQAEESPPDVELEHFVHVKVAGQLEPTITALMQQFRDDGFQVSEPELTDVTGRFQATGHGYQVAVEGTVSDVNMRVIDVSYQVTSSS